MILYEALSSWLISCHEFIKKMRKDLFYSALHTFSTYIFLIFPKSKRCDNQHQTPQWHHIGSPTALNHLRSYLQIIYHSGQQNQSYTNKTPSNPMLQIQNLDDLDIFNSPDFSRKTSDCLNQTNLTNMESNEYCSIIHLHDTYKECRICLERTQDPQNSFTSPCRCTGSLKYVHKICFITWLTRQLSLKSSKEQKSLKEEGIACEICKMKVYLEFKNYKKCLSSEEINSKIKNQPVYFALLLVFLVIITTSLSFIIYYMQNRSMSSFGVDIMATSVLVCALVFLVASALFTIYYLVNRFFVEERNKLESFTTQKKIRARTRKQTIPVEHY